MYLRSSPVRRGCQAGIWTVSYRYEILWVFLWSYRVGACGIWAKTRSEHKIVVVKIVVDLLFSLLP